MKLFNLSWDGGKNSGVRGLFIVEIKSLFSIVLLKFNKGSRENYHSHAFNAWTWFLSGEMTEYRLDGKTYNYRRSFMPKLTKRDNMHKVYATKTSYAMSLRGPWADFWVEYSPKLAQFITLTHGRKIVRTDNE